MSSEKGTNQESEKDPILPKYKNDTEYESLSPVKEPRPGIDNGTCKLLLVLAILVILMAVISLSVGLGTYYGLKTTKKNSLPDNIDIRDLTQLLFELQETTVSNSRSVLNGYNNSAEYVIRMLKENGYTNIKKDYFTIPLAEDGEGRFTVQVTFPGDSNVNFEYPQYSQFQIMIYSAGCSEACTWELVSLLDDEEGEFGCSTSSIDVSGKAVLVPYETERGNCSIYDKAYTLNEAGAAAIIYVSGNPSSSVSPPRNRVYELIDGKVNYVDIPSIGVNNATGNQLLEFINTATTVEITLEVSSSVVDAYTYNIITETDGGRGDRTVMIGSHLDSVPAGPGINDDGSGSMLNLLIAMQIARLGLQPVNKVRFTWWGAEELGLLGSRHYVAALTDKELEDISLYLNFDMVGSTNFRRGIHSGDSAGDDERQKRASIVIQNVFEEYLKDTDNTFELVPFTSGSDYRPFLNAGVPAGGLSTGAGSLKTQEQYRLFGGILGAPLDPCYHKACDTVDNINSEVYELMVKTAAYTLQTLMEKEDLERFLYP